MGLPGGSVMRKVPRLQETQVHARCGALRHRCWARALGPKNHNYCILRPQSLCSALRRPCPTAGGPPQLGAAREEPHSNEDPAQPTKKRTLPTPKNYTNSGLPWWSRGQESACQCRGHRFNPWSRKISHAAGQLKPTHHNY